MVIDGASNNRLLLFIELIASTAKTEDLVGVGLVIWIVRLMFVRRRHGAGRVTFNEFKRQKR